MQKVGISVYVSQPRKASKKRWHLVRPWRMSRYRWERKLAWTWDGKSMWIVNSSFWLIERRAHHGVAEVRLHTRGDSVRVTTGKVTKLGRGVIRLTSLYHHSQGLGCSTRFKCSLLPAHLPKGSLQQVLKGLKDSLLPLVSLAAVSSLCPWRNKFPLGPEGPTIEFFRKPSWEWEILRQL